jgi:hypothetical protein
MHWGLLDVDPGGIHQRLYTGPSCVIVLEEFHTACNSKARTQNRHLIRFATWVQLAQLAAVQK